MTASPSSSTPTTPSATWSMEQHRQDLHRRDHQLEGRRRQRRRDRPDRPRGRLSGTRDGFESITGTKDKCQYRQELTSTGDVITTVCQNPDAIGYASLAAHQGQRQGPHRGRRRPQRGHRQGRQLCHPASLRPGDQGGQRPSPLRPRRSSTTPPLLTRLRSSPRPARWRPTERKARSGGRSATGAALPPERRYAAMKEKRVLESRHARLFSCCWGW